MRNLAPPTRSARGMTLLEIVVVLAILGIVGSMAVPAYQASLARAQRAEAIDALTRLHLAQESFRAANGSYALAMNLLHGVGAPLSRYRMDIVSAHASGFIARATVIDRGFLDGGCNELSLTVTDGQAIAGPTERCWNR